MSHEGFASSEGQLPAAARELIKQVLREHPFWDYEKIATELREFGIGVSAIYVAWVLDGGRGIPQ